MPRLLRQNVKTPKLQILDKASFEMKHKARMKGPQRVADADSTFYLSIVSCSAKMPFGWFKIRNKLWVRIPWSVMF